MTEAAIFEDNVVPPWAAPYVTASVPRYRAGSMPSQPGSAYFMAAGVRPSSPPRRPSTWTSSMQRLRGRMGGRPDRTTQSANIDVAIKAAGVLREGRLASSPACRS